jgi:hypothetical protein
VGSWPQNSKYLIFKGETFNLSKDFTVLFKNSPFFNASTVSF